MTNEGRERLTLELIGGDGHAGLLLGALMDSRGRTLRELDDVDDAMLSWHPPIPLPTIGTLIYHIALIEADWLLDDMLQLPEASWPPWIAEAFPIEVRDAEGRLAEIPPESLEAALTRLARVRQLVVGEVSSMADADLHSPRAQPAYDVSPAWALHHLLQHEAEHRAHIALLRDLFRAAGK